MLVKQVMTENIEALRRHGFGVADPRPRRRGAHWQRAQRRTATGKRETTHD